MTSAFCGASLSLADLAIELKTPAHPRHTLMVDQHLPGVVASVATQVTALMSMPGVTGRRSISPTASTAEGSTVTRRCPVAIVTGAGGGPSGAISLHPVPRPVIWWWPRTWTRSVPPLPEPASPPAAAERTPCRLDDQASRAELVAGVLDRHGRIDVLVNCAGIFATRGSET